MTTETPLAKLLREMGIRQDWIATRLHVHESLVSKWVNGDRTIGPDYVRALSELLGVPPEKIQPEDRRENENN